jgi:propionyl-CoA carboxylase beta subunit
MITAVSDASVPQLSVLIRKAYGAGLYAMDGPGFMPDACIALPTARVAVMGPEAAVNAVYANKIAEIADPDEREAFVKQKRAEYEADVDLLRLASDLVIDAIINPSELRGELSRRYATLTGKARPMPDKRHGVPPV